MQKLGLKAIKHEDYTNSGFARGHLAPAEDFSRTQEAIESTFVMSNVIPQKGSLNSGAWAQLERKVRSWACGEESITVITGPILEDDLDSLNSGIVIPLRFFKIVIDNTPPSKKIGFIYYQDKKGQNVIDNVWSVKQLEKLAKLQHFDSSTESFSVAEWKQCNPIER